MIWLGYLLLLVVALGGAALVVITWPGLWLMTGAAAAYALFTHARYLGVGTLFVLLGLTVGGEIMEWLLARSAARKSGSGTSGAVGAFVGGIVGGLAASFIPVVIISTILGICVGSFCGAAIAEWLVGGAVTHSLRVGVGAAKGRLLGFFGKVVIAGAMLLVILVMAFP